jgi:hypothetical protein
MARDYAHGGIARFSSNNENPPSYWPRGVAWMLPWLVAAGEGARVMSSVKPSAASIDLVSCAAFERIVAKTGSSLYEVIVLRGEPGRVLVRGGKHFTTFCPVLFVGSTRPNGAIEQHTIEIGLRMKFYFENMVIVTSVVQSLCRYSTTAATACGAATR